MPFQDQAFNSIQSSSNTYHFCHIPDLLRSDPEACSAKDLER